MKSALLSFTILVAFSIDIKAQENKPEILMEPPTWAFEKFPLPPSFATAITYKGFEELRFAPGMFKKEAHDYFTYVFVAQIDSSVVISQEDVKNYLVSYYQGLCAVTAKDRKLVIDTSKINATVYRQKKSTAKDTSYDAIVHLFGVFADGAPVTLNVEVSLIKNAPAKKTWLFFIASPLPKKDKSWKQLYGIRSRSLSRFQ
jgi:hypothetical protein